MPPVKITRLLCWHIGKNTGGGKKIGYLTELGASLFYIYSYLNCAITGDYTITPIDNTYSVSFTYRFCGFCF
jgi:hypothetical protein